MKNYTTAYRLTNERESITFESEKDACKYLGVAKCSVASCYRRNRRCKGYTIERIGITTHHRTGTRLFKIWGGMIERCYREKHPHYKSYGGRGIAVCDEWQGEQGFYRFSEWATANGYADNLTIDRINNDGNYEPNNCRWITIKEQMSNKRTNHWVNVNGERLTITQCSEQYGIPKSTVRWRADHNRDILTGAKMGGEENDSK